MMIVMTRRTQTQIRFAVRSWTGAVVCVEAATTAEAAAVGASLLGTEPELVEVALVPARRVA